MFDGNEPSRGELIPDRPSGTKPIGAFGVIEHDGRGLREWVLYAGASHFRGAYHDEASRLKRLCGLEGVEMVDQLTQPARATAVGGKGQSRQVLQVRLVEFFGERPAQFEGAPR